MPIEPDPLKNSQPAEVQIPPELAEIENRLRGLRRCQGPAVDRDELMFQSGYAAAKAELDFRVPEKTGSSHWGWPVLSGSLAAIAAALAVALWLAPISGGEGQLAITPKQNVDTAVVAADESETGRAEDSNQALVANHPIEHGVAPRPENIVGSKSSPLLLSVLGVRNHLRRGIELEEIPRPRIDGVSVLPRRAPLKVNSYRDQKLWEQL